MTRKEKLSQLKEGDKITRMLSGIIPMELVITKITETAIFAGLWEFDIETGYEIDLDLGWDGKTVSGSFIKL